MNNKVGNISYYDPCTGKLFYKPYSEKQVKLIDEGTKLIDGKYKNH